MRIKDHIYSHTGLRGIAALSVSPLHMFTESYIGNEAFSFLKRYVLILPSVDLFFILSGFILCYVYSDIEKRQWKNYFWARFARIYPLHILILCIIGFFVFLGYFLRVDTTEYDFKEFPLQLTLLQSLPYFNVRSWNGPAWSVSMEIFGYVVLFPLLYMLKNAKLPTYFFYLILVLSLIGVHLFYTDNFFNIESFIQGWGGIYRFTFCFVAGFVVCVLADRQEKLTSFLVEKNNWLLSVFVLVLLSSAFIAIPKFIVYALMVLAVWATARNGQTIGSRFLSSKIVLSLGLASYSLYLWHALIGKAGYILPSKFIFWEAGGLLGWLIFGFLYSGVVVWSLITYKYFEEPVRAFLVRKNGRA